MEGDLQGSSATSPAPESTAAPADALTTSEPTSAGAVVESQGVDGADDQQPTPGDEPAEDDGDDEESTTDDTPADPRKPSRKERQRQREAEARDKAVAEAIAAYQREQEAAETRKQQEAAAKAAQEAAAKELAEFLGEPGEVERLQAEAVAITRQRQRVEQGLDTTTDLNALYEREIEVVKRLEQIEPAKKYEDALRRQIWGGIEPQILTPLTWPELASPEAKQKFMYHEGGLTGALQFSRELIRTAAIAEKDAEIATLKATHATEMKAAEAQIGALRVRLGGDEIVSTVSGAPTTNGGLYTRQRLRDMMQTPAGMAEYRRNKAEIERQERAGLIR